MTKNELIAENKWLRERAEKAEAALAHTEEAARMYCGRTMAAEERMQKAAARAAAAREAAAAAAWEAAAAAAAWKNLGEIMRQWYDDQEEK